MSADLVTIVEVGPRDGFQSIIEPIATEKKIEIITMLHAAGIRRVEATAFVSPKAVPQLADAAALLSAVHALPGLDAQVLVPNLRNAERALEAGARHIAFVLSVSPQHNLSNVRRSPEESANDFASILAVLPVGVKVRLNLATAFDCPFTGPVAPSETLALLARLMSIAPEGVEVCLCDTTGRVTPDRVKQLFELARDRFPEVSRWAYHGHDTYGLGVANALAAWRVGVTVLDASFAGLGGCPFAPGATGNVATEDVVWTFQQMGIRCDIDLERLLVVAREGAALPGGLHGGRVRTALSAQIRRERVA